MEKILSFESILGESWSDKNVVNMIDLVNAEYSSLSEQSKQLRAMAMNLLHSFERKPVNTASDARALLENHHLPVRKGKWVAVAINAGKERHYARTKNGLRLVHHLSSNFPKFDELEKFAPLPEGGKYLIIFGGKVNDLSKEENVKAWNSLKGKVPVADILVLDESDGVVTFWSIGAKIGQIGNNVVSLPNDIKIDNWSLDE